MRTRLWLRGGVKLHALCADPAELLAALGKAGISVSDFTDLGEKNYSFWVEAARREEVLHLGEKVGAEITLRQGFDLKTVVVLGLSEERRCFAEASKLYQETPESIARREKDAEARRINAYFSPRPDEKPDKKQRRELLRLKNSFGDEE